MIPEGSIISGFISKIISDCIDISPYTIKNVDNNRKHNEQNLQTKIYQVIIDVLNRITNNTYKKQEKIYIVAEKILNGFKNNDGNVIEAIKSGLNIINNTVTNDECQKFLETLYQEISNEKNINLYREILLLLLQQANKQNYIEIKKQLELINRKLSKHDVESQKIETPQEKEFQNNKKQKYIDNWNSILFLHQNNKENPIPLSKAFVTPNYKICTPAKEIEFSSKDTLDEILNKFMQYKKTSTMLIIGVPGIGKSTIISWIANQYKDNDNIIILKFRDWDNNELNDGLLNAICNTLCCKKGNLENKILILDGFDEIKCLNKREYLLNIFFNNIKDFDNIKIIITSRLNYIDSKYFRNVIELQTFNMRKIDEFYKKITNKGLYRHTGTINGHTFEMIDISDELFIQMLTSNFNALKAYEESKPKLAVLGIPVILYMAIMSDIDIDINSTEPELYNCIFAEDGGIFDKFDQYDNGDQILRNSENIKKHLRFLQEIAFKMFEKNKLILNKDEYEIPPLEFNGNYVSILEFPIKHLFENTESNIEFIHKSIYEYFVSEYIFISINQAINKKSSKEELAKILGSMFIKNLLSFEILEFLNFKIKNNKPDKIFDIINNIFNLMLKNGMTYYTKNYYKNIIDCEINIFANMLEFLHLWEPRIFKFNKHIIDYIKYNHTIPLNLKNGYLKKLNLAQVNLVHANLVESNLINSNLTRADLTNANLTSADLTSADLTSANLTRIHLGNSTLTNANLSHANLTKAILINAHLTGANLTNADLTNTNLINANLTTTNLTNADLTNADLTNADLTNADLTNADLIEINLTGANLNNTIFSEDQIEYLEKNYNLQNSVVYIKKTIEDISYKEYCKRRKEN